MTASLRFLSQLKIGTRICAGFGMVLAPLVGLAGVAFWSLDGLGKNFESFSEMARDMQIVGELKSDITDVQLQVREYLAAGTKDELRQVREAYARLDKLIGLAKTEIREPARAKLLADVTGLKEHYIKAFDRVSALTEKRNALVNDTLEPTGAALRGKLTEINQSAYKDMDYQSATYAGVVQEDLLLARLYLARFLATNDLKDAERAQQQFKELHASAAMLDKSLENPARRAMFEAVKGELPRYKKAFEDIVATITERNVIRRDVLDKDGALIIEKAETLIARAVADMKALDKSVGDAVRSGEIEAIVLGLIAVVVGLLAAASISRGLTGPIGGMVDAMKRLAGGDTNVDVPARARADEVGAMAKAVEVFKQSMIEADRLRTTHAEEVAVKERRAAAMATAVEEFEAAIGDVVKTVASAASEMQSAARSMSETAEETSRRATAVSAASEEASSNVQTVASAGEELSSSIAEIGRQVANSARIAGKAVEDAQRTDAKVQGLAETAQRIGDVVQLINDIAAQTNLLALNATIEAARAGEAGKGFAVVASEVKSLANRTAKATEEIGAQITAIRGATKDSVEAIKSIGATITEINEIATAIASAVEEQGAATQEIARNVQEAAKGTTEVSSNITGVTKAAAETGAASTQVLGAAGDLAEQAERLRGQVDLFLGKVRAA